jgi:hypothetical protein
MNAYIRSLSKNLGRWREDFLTTRHRLDIERNYGRWVCDREAYEADWLVYSASKEFEPYLRACKAQAALETSWMSKEDRLRPESADSVSGNAGRAWELRLTEKTLRDLKVQHENIIDGLDADPREDRCSLFSGQYPSMLQKAAVAIRMQRRGTKLKDISTKMSLSRGAMSMYVAHARDVIYRDRMVNARFPLTPSPGPNVRRGTLIPPAHPSPDVPEMSPLTADIIANYET